MFALDVALLFLYRIAYRTPNAPIMTYVNPSAKCVEWPADQAWIKRNPQIWIHGRTNFETPPPLLDKAGFITPADMFFVRQHSEVPRVVAEGGNPDDHSIFVEQVVHDKTAAKPSDTKKVMKTITLSLKDLKSKFEKVTVTSMLCCSGQRRYEMNLVEQTGGAISWHNSCGNCTWGGCRLRDVLEHMGVSTDLKVSKFVEFQGKEGYKGCIPFRKAHELYGDVLVCWEQNGEPLLPDHGQPLRIVVPGYSSKTSTKWLTGISVRDMDCEFGKHKSYYKLFPTALKPGTDEYAKHVGDPEYTIGELNVNSVIFEPHSQTLCGRPGPLKVSGYAHTGGGRLMSRIEVSANGGKTWEQVRPLKQEPTDAGNLWAWVRYEHILQDFDPNAEDAEVVVRAWDNAANTQPEWPIWNYTGMLNNHLYRVKCISAEGQRVFVHPAQWMDPKFKHGPADKKFATNQYDDARKERIAGPWLMGDFSDAMITVEVSDGHSDALASKEPRWSGQKLQAEMFKGSNGELEVLATFGGLEVVGTVSESENAYRIQWRNGMVWIKQKA